MLILFWVLNTMYILPEDSQYDRDVWHVLTGPTKVTVVNIYQFLI
jgi:hypothetical protein